MLIAQISDLHVTARGTRPFPGIDTNQRLAAAVGHLNRMDPRPDLVLITGDLVNGPADGEYEALLDGLSGLDIPWRALPGNHDDRDRMRQAFGTLGWLPMEGEFLHYAVDEFPVRILMLDSVIPRTTVGRLCPQRLAWVAQRLTEHTERPTLVALHQPPFPTAQAVLDTLGCREGGAELGAMLRGRPNILGVLCGHNHRATSVNWQGVPGFVAPSAAYPFALDLRPVPTYGWSEEAPAVALHLYKPGVGLITHLSPIANYPAKPFS